MRFVEDKNHVVGGRNPENIFPSNVLGNFLQKLKLNFTYSVKVVLILAENMMAT